jgi:hypothetical protein
MLAALSALLDDDGILFVGTNGNNLQSRYAVYRKCADQPTRVEFSFSLDNLRPFGVLPWFTIHANDPEALLLAQLTGTFRRHRDFWPVFNRRVDELLEKRGICRRLDDGFLEFIALELPMAELIGRMAGVWRQITDEGYPEAMVDLLRQSGWETWINPVGHITVRPPAGALPIF